MPVLLQIAVDRQTGKIVSDKTKRCVTDFLHMKKIELIVCYKLLMIICLIYIIFYLWCFSIVFAEHIF